MIRAPGIGKKASDAGGCFVDLVAGLWAGGTGPVGQCGGAGGSDGGGGSRLYRRDRRGRWGCERYGDCGVLAQSHARLVGSGGICAANTASAELSRTVTCAAAGLSSLVIRVVPLSQGTLTAVVGVIGSDADPFMGNNRASAMVTVTLGGRRRPRHRPSRLRRRAPGRTRARRRPLGRRRRARPREQYANPTPRSRHSYSVGNRYQNSHEYATLEPTSATRTPTQTPTSPPNSTPTPSATPHHRRIEHRHRPGRRRRPPIRHRRPATLRRHPPTRHRRPPGRRLRRSHRRGRPRRSPRPTRRRARRRLPVRACSPTPLIGRIRRSSGTDGRKYRGT